MTRRNAGFTAGMLAVVVLLLEAVSFVGGRLLQKKGLMWAPPSSRQAAIPYSDYLARRDELLGWPYRDQYGRDLGPNGAQLRPGEQPRGPSVPCVSLYGDSYTAGTWDVSSPLKNWANQLADQLGCPVTNFGVVAYGTDQAYLRFAVNEHDHAPIVVFGFHTDDVLRNLTRLRDLQNRVLAYALKPRFVINERNELELVPLPSLTEREYRRAIGLEREFLALEQENFQPGGAAGVVPLRFPFSFSLVRNIARYEILHSSLRREPPWMRFLEPSHPLHGLQITAGITEKFVDLARHRGKTPIVVILPHLADFQYYLAHGRWPYENLANEYVARGIPFLDFGPYLIAAAHQEGKRPADYFGESTHYNDSGNALVAQFMHAQFTGPKAAELGEVLLTAAARHDDTPSHR